MSTKMKRKLIDVLILAICTPVALEARTKYDTPKGGADGWVLLGTIAICDFLCAFFDLLEQFGKPK